MLKALQAGVGPVTGAKAMREDTRKRNQQIWGDGSKLCSDLAPARLKE